MNRKPRRLVLLMATLLCSAGAAWAQSAPQFESLGDDTYTVNVHATHKFTRNTKRLAALATEAAEEFCRKEGKVMKLVSVDDKRGIYGVGEFANATVTFKALNPGDPKLAGQGAPGAATTITAPPPPLATPTDVLYSELTKLDELRRRGILTEEEFATEKKKVLDRSR